MSQRADELADYSEAIIGGGSKSFAAAARLLDSAARESAYMLYAWCRYCDDQIDRQYLGFRVEGEAVSSRARLEQLELKTRRALAGEPVEHPAFMALQRVVDRHRIPDHYPLQLLQGFAMDVDEYRYDEFEDTLLYCYHVAGVVGVMMAYVMGVKRSDTLQRAADLGIAFQLTNISRDVLDDARAGRVYLPRSWLAEAGIPPTEVVLPEHRPALFAVVRRLLGEAERYYESAAEGLRELRFRQAWGIATARIIYREIGRVVIERGPAAWDQRVVVSRGRKAYGALLGLLGAVSAVSVGKLMRPRIRVGLWIKQDDRGDMGQ